MEPVGVIMNLGTGPVGGSTSSRDAWSNARALRRELYRLDPEMLIEIDRDATADDRQGRYGFVFRAGERRCSVDVPGCRREDLDFRPGHLPPRLYVDGNSWCWDFAIGWVWRDLTGSDPPLYGPRSPDGAPPSVDW